ncbi:MAG TPA: hypothetical protein VKA08_17215 [Balneolales bacterium]|nr:hypothetical protein [Balneolales bacterium]
MRTSTTSLGLVITILAAFILTAIPVLAQTEYPPLRGTTPPGKVVFLSSLPPSSEHPGSGTVNVLPYHPAPPYSAAVEKYREEQAASDTLKVTEDRDGNAPAPAGSSTIEGLSPSSSSTTQATLNENFQGITQWDNKTPPDPVIAAGPNYVIEAVNLAFAIFDKSGNKVSQTDFSTLFGSLADNVSLTDPKVIYDQYSQRYVMLLLGYSATYQKGVYLIAVSQSSNPTGSWYTYSSDATLDGSTSTSNAPDYPGLGYDSNAIYVSSDQISDYGGGNFDYAKIRIFDKSQLYNDQTLTYTDFTKMTDNYGYVRTIKPAQHFGTTSSAYLLNTERLGGSSVTLWRIENPLSSPTISHTTLVWQRTVAIIPSKLLRREPPLKSREMMPEPRMSFTETGISIRPLWINTIGAVATWKQFAI